MRRFSVEVRSLLPGLTLALAIASAASFLGRLVPVIGGAVFSIVCGMSVAFFPRNAVFSSGVKFASKRVLQGAVILLGFEMNLGAVLRTGGESLGLMAVTVAAALGTAFLFTKILAIAPNTGILVGVGTAVCGGSAIAAVSPVIGADDGEIARAVSTIFLFNVAAVFVFPALGRILGMSEDAFGLWAGTAVNDTSSVLAAAYSFGDAAGEKATIVKLTRTLLIIPISLALALFRAGKEKSVSGSGFSFVSVFPWFVLGFLVASVLRTLGFVGHENAALLSGAGKFLICVAMAAIGLNTHLVKLLSNGMKPLLLGFLTWLAVASSCLAVLWMGGLW